MGRVRRVGALELKGQKAHGKPQSRKYFLLVKACQLNAGAGSNEKDSILGGKKVVL